MATSSLHLIDGVPAMPQPNDLSSSLVAVDQNSGRALGSGPRLDCPFQLGFLGICRGSQAIGKIGVLGSVHFNLLAPRKRLLAQRTMVQIGAGNAIFQGKG